MKNHTLTKEEISALVRFIMLRTQMDMLWEKHGENWLRAWLGPEEELPSVQIHPFRCSCYPGCPAAPYNCPGCDGGLCT